MKSNNINTNYVLTSDGVASKFTEPRGEQPTREELISIAADAVVADCREFPPQTGETMEEYIDVLAEAAAQGIVSYNVSVSFSDDVADEIAAIAFQTLS